MTIPSTNIYVEDFNSNMNKVSNSQFTFDDLYRFTGDSPMFKSNYDVANARNKINSSDGYYCLIKCDGANGATTVSDITKTFNLASMGTATISTAQSKFGGASLYTDNTGTSFTLGTTPTNLNLTSYSGDWTIEMFTYYQNGGSGVSRFISGFAGTYDSSVRFGGTQLHAYYFEPPGNDFRSIVYNLGSRPTNVWFHWAFVKHGTNLYLYYNGNRVGSTTCAGNAMAMNYFYVGQSATEFFTGYLDEIRFTNYARYTGTTYTVPTASYN